MGFQGGLVLGRVDFRVTVRISVKVTERVRLREVLG